MPLRHLGAILGALAACAWASPARAQERPSVAVLATATGDGVDAELGPSLDGALRQQLESVDAIELRGEAALDLADIQLALGCEGASAECLSAVASELAARQLVIPRLSAEGPELRLEVALFDAEEARQVRSVERRAPGDAGGRLLDVMVDVVRELLDVHPEIAEPEPDSDPDPRPPPEPPPPSDDGAGARLGIAAALAGLGVVTLAIGGGVGAWSQDSAHRYAQQPLTTDADAGTALGLLRSAQEQALVANVLFVVGGAVTAAGVAWLIAELAGGDS